MLKTEFMQDKVVAKTAAELATEARELLKPCCENMAELSAGLVMDKLSTKLELYIVDEDMELSELAKYFSVKEFSEILQDGINQSATEFYAVFEEDADYIFSRGTLTGAFRSDCNVLIKPYLESIATVEFAGATLLEHSPSIVTALTKENIDEDIILFGLTDNNNFMANCFDDDIDEDCSTAAAEIFDESFQKSMEKYELLFLSLMDAGSKMLTNFFLENIKVSEDDNDIDDLGELVSGFTEYLTDINND